MTDTRRLAAACGYCWTYDEHTTPECIAHRQGATVEYGYTTIKEARDAVERAEQDTEATYGPEALGDPSVYFELVRAIADDCAPAVKAELLRTEGLDPTL